jgi:glutathione S-transferase
MPRIAPMRAAFPFNISDRFRAMILVGQYDSPNVRRVAVTLGVLGFAFERDPRSVFGDFDSMRTVNPLGRVPSLILPDGTTLIDSAAILDWLDQKVGPERAAAAGRARTATGTATGAAAHRTRDRRDRQGHGFRLRAAGPARGLSLA